MCCRYGWLSNSGSVSFRKSSQNFSMLWQSRSLKSSSSMALTFMGSLLELNEGECRFSIVRVCCTGGQYRGGCWEVGLNEVSQHKSEELGVD